jgi:hypothetical protein
MKENQQLVFGFRLMSRIFEELIFPFQTKIVQDEETLWCRTLADFFIK